MSDVSYAGPLNQWLAQAPPQPPPRVMGKSLAELLGPYLADSDQAQAASEAAAQRVRAPYAKANERVSGLPDVGTVLGNKLVNTLMAGPRLMGQVAEGSIDPNSPEGIRRATDVASSTLGWGMLGAERGAAGIFGGRLAKTADQAALTRATEMEAAGHPKEDIWSATGWFKGADDKWRFEIPDEKSALTGPAADALERGDVGGHVFFGPAGDVMSHHELYGAYPDLKSMETFLQKGGGYPYSPSGQLIEREINMGRRPYNFQSVELNANTPQQARDINLHELQHAVQGNEGFAAGSSPRAEMQPINERLLELYKQLQTTDIGDPNREVLKQAYEALRGQRELSAFDSYRRSAGEVESRNVQARKDMNTEQRRAAPPWTTEDVPREQQIVRGATGGPTVMGKSPAKLLEPYLTDQGPQMSVGAPDRIGFQSAGAQRSEATGSTAPRLTEAEEAAARQRSADYQARLKERLANKPAAEPAKPIAGGERVGFKSLGTAKTGALSDFITAYHGSPHDFDRFDLSKVGTGEGAQAYGRGLYFAQNEAVAKQYRADLADKTYLTGSGKDRAAEPYGGIYQALEMNAGTTGVHPDISRAAATNVLKAVEDSGSIEKALKEYDFPVNDPRAGKAYQEAIATAQRMNLRANKGNMYQVAIKAPPEHFLDWDKPLSEQHPAALEKLKTVVRPDPNRTVADWINHSPGAERRLREAGIPGIKYLDQGSRASTPIKGGSIQFQNGQYHVFDEFGAVAGKAKSLDEAKAIRDGKVSPNPTSNYVVFDDKLIDILKKYGIAGIGALPAMNAYHYQDKWN